MIQFGAIVRAVMLVVCLVPFTSVQQASGALAPYFPAAPEVERESSDGPAEEDDERETETDDERHASSSRHRAAVRELIGKLPPTHVSHRVRAAHASARPPVAADPFRNGLGTHYRC